MSPAPQRIAIIGNAAGGKSRLARRLGTRLDLPVHVVDDVQWLPGWKPAPLPDVARAHDEWLAGGRWIIDGWGAWDLLERRFLAADVVILVDLPLTRHVMWAARRHVNVVLGRSEGWPPAGCRAAPVTLRLLRILWWIHREQRPRLVARLTQPDLRAKLLRVRSVADLQAAATGAWRPG